MAHALLSFSRLLRNVALDRAPLYSPRSSLCDLNSFSACCSRGGTPNAHFSLRRTRT
jgi:hypothetical protein